MTNSKKNHYSKWLKDNNYNIKNIWKASNAIINNVTGKAAYPKNNTNINMMGLVTKEFNVCLIGEIAKTGSRDDKDKD